MAKLAESALVLDTHSRFTGRWTTHLRVENGRAWVEDRFIEPELQAVHEQRLVALRGPEDAHE